MLIGILWISLSCATQKNAEKKLDKLLTRFPALQEKDTITVHDTVSVTIPGTKGKKSIPLKSDSCECMRSDTVYLDTAQLHARAWISDDSLHIAAECDTVTKEVSVKIEVPVDRIIYRRPRDVLSYMVSILVGFIIGYYLRSREKPPK